MPKPTRVRVSFELTREEASRLRHHTGADVSATGAPEYIKLVVALDRGLARYDARTSRVTQADWDALAAAEKRLDESRAFCQRLQAKYARTKGEAGDG